MEVWKGEGGMVFCECLRVAFSGGYYHLPTYLSLDFPRYSGAHFAMSTQARWWMMDPGLGILSVYKGWVVSRADIVIEK